MKAVSLLFLSLFISTVFSNTTFAKPAEEDKIYEHALCGSDGGTMFGPPWGLRKCAKTEAREKIKQYCSDLKGTISEIKIVDSRCDYYNAWGCDAWAEAYCSNRKK